MASIGFSEETKISVIVPVYKAEQFIEQNLIEIKKRIQEMFPVYEIIAVIDGEVDNSKEEALKVKGIEVLSYKENKGKGHALYHGFLHSNGRFITFIDCDLDLNPSQIINFVPYLTSADFAVGSKRHPFSKLQYPFLRKVLSFGFFVYSYLILGVHLKDTQSGLKLVKREVLEIIMPLLLVKRFSFDLELCFLAQKHGFRTVEVPLHLTYQQFEGVSTTIRLKDIFAMFFEVLLIRYHYSIKKTYQKNFWKNKNWQ
ncbi:MAG: glycosyltransferase [Bacteroidales bacterium]|nr:glycosyltransferase [Bacteroidales bacterium]MBN2818210.1 glycosyltransferase [Bacteroidales bacterium]